MDPEVYLKSHHLMRYIEDATGFLLDRREEDPKTKPFELLAEYFKSVKNGSHVLFREYAYVSLTPHNRSSFLGNLWQSYVQIATRGDMIKIAEHLSLVRLLCHDFPAELVQKVAQVMFSHNVTENIISFSDFIYVFQVLFFYECFLSRCEALFSDVARGQSHHPLLGGSTVVVSMPRLMEQDSRSGTTASDGDAASLERESSALSQQVDASVFLKAATSLIKRMSDREMWQSVPSCDAVAEVVSKVSKLSFYEFVIALSRSEQVNSEIGALPQLSASRTPSVSSSLSDVT